MVKITNGTIVCEVTRGAFDGIYSRQGFTIVEDENEKVSGVNPDNASEKTEDEKFLEEIIEKPISQWTKEETKRFVVLNEINTEGCKNTNEVKEIVKKFIEDSQE